MLEHYGQVKITNQDNKPHQKVYVKCYSKSKTNQVEFFRDGYTDLRGCFDYAQSSAIDIDEVESFSIFINSKDYGIYITNNYQDALSKKLRNLSNSVE